MDILIIKESIDQVANNYISSVLSSVVKSRIFRNTKTILGNMDIITKNAEKYMTKFYFYYINIIIVVK